MYAYGRRIGRYLRTQAKSKQRCERSANAQEFSTNQVATCRYILFIANEEPGPSLYIKFN